jgi:hypothetical protein
VAGILCESTVTQCGCRLYIKAPSPPKFSLAWPCGDSDRHPTSPIDTIHHRHEVDHLLSFPASSSPTSSSTLSSLSTDHCLVRLSTFSPHQSLFDVCSHGYILCPDFTPLSSSLSLSSLPRTSCFVTLVRFRPT